MTILAFDHYTLRCADLQASWRSYADVLGLRVTERPRTGRLHHIARQASGLAEMRRRLSAAAYRFTERTLPTAAKHLVHVKDPDNVEVELAFTLQKLDAAGA